MTEIVKRARRHYCAYCGEDIGAWNSDSDRRDTCCKFECERFARNEMREEREKILALAKTCGASRHNWYSMESRQDECELRLSPECLETFYLAAYREGMEEAARICEQLDHKIHGAGREDSEACDCADAIRERMKP